MTLKHVKAPDPCKKCAESSCPSGSCAYCGAMLSTRHEHDHAPVPARHGGKETIPVCQNCHDLKDRIPYHKWDAERMLVEMEDAPPHVRILIALLIGELFDLKAELDEARAA